MAQFEIPEIPVYTETAEKLSVTDPAHAEIFNKLFSILFANNSYIFEKVKELFKHVGDTGVHVTEEKKAEWDAIGGQSRLYTDSSIAALIGNAPEKLNTIYKLAEALLGNQDIVETLKNTLGDKLDAAEYEKHVNDKNIHNSKADLVNLLYPVGSIYQSARPADPGTLFGGRWQQIKDVVLVAAGSKFTAGTTGGSMTHTLTVSNMPAHSHAFTGAKVNTAVNSLTPSAAFKGTAVTSGSQSANHTHSVTAKGTISSDSHTHKVSDIPGGLAQLVINQGNNIYGNVVSNTGTKTSTKDTHKHTFTGTAVTSGTVSANHTHRVTANGTVTLANTSHTHEVTSAGTVGMAGSGVAVNHMPPYQVMYVWERVA